MYQNYNTMETALTLQLDFTIPSDHEARLISRFDSFGISPGRDVSYRSPCLSSCDAFEDVLVCL